MNYFFFKPLNFKLQWLVSFFMCHLDFNCKINNNRCHPFKYQSIFKRTDVKSFLIKYPFSKLEAINIRCEEMLLNAYCFISHIDDCRLIFHFCQLL